MLKYGFDDVNEKALRATVPSKILMCYDIKSFLWMVILKYKINYTYTQKSKKGGCAAI